MHGMIKETVYAVVALAIISFAHPAHAQEKLADLESYTRFCKEADALERKTARCGEYEANPKKFIANLRPNIVDICKSAKRQCRGPQNARMHMISSGLGCGDRDFCWYERR
jgi:predicted RNA-binding Zn ribbon-like protein